MKKIISVVLCLTLLLSSSAFFAVAQQYGYCTVCYVIDDDDVSEDVVPSGRPIELRSEYAMRQYGDQILVGWKTESGTEYYYDNTGDTGFWWPDCASDLVLRHKETCVLRPIWCPIALRAEEVFSFTNSESVFNADVDGYLFTRQHFMRIFPNWFCTFAFSVFAPLAAVICAFFLTVWPTMDFNGSCCGFPICALLQHYGRIDLLSEQGVSEVCELEPDETVQSAINYYNIHAVPGSLTNHLALVPGTEEYSKQLHALYDTLEGGTPVYFELYGDREHLVRTALIDPVSVIKDIDDLTAHGVLLTGAYTDGNGNHILIMYDNNSMNYVNGTCNIIWIDPDFTQIRSSYAHSDDHVLNGFSWNDSLDQFDSFKLSGVSNPFSWHVQFLKNFSSLLRQIVAVYKLNKAR